jgi:hypothetical protein
VEEEPAWFLARRSFQAETSRCHGVELIDPGTMFGFHVAVTAETASSQQLVRSPVLLLPIFDVGERSTPARWRPCPVF